jgi:hypothetical protein
MDIADQLTHSRVANDANLAGSMEIDAAIEMVRLGAAKRMRLVAMSDPDGLAAIALARAQAAGVAFRLERDRGSVTLTFEWPESAEPASEPTIGG